MPETAKAVVERLVELFNEGFAPGQTAIPAEVRAIYAPEPVIVPFRAALEGTEYRGPTALDDFVAETRESWEWVQIEPDEFRELDGDRVLVVGRLRGSGRETGAEASTTIAFLITVCEGRVAKAQTFLSERDALEAVGE